MQCHFIWTKSEESLAIRMLGVSCFMFTFSQIDFFKNGKEASVRLDRKKCNTFLMSVWSLKALGNEDRQLEVSTESSWLKHEGIYQRAHF